MNDYSLEDALKLVIEAAEKAGVEFVGLKVMLDVETAKRLLEAINTWGEPIMYTPLSTEPGTYH